MMKTLKIKVICIIILFSVCFMGVFAIPTGDALALTGNADDYMKIALLTGLLNCYEGNGTAEGWSIKGNGIEYKDFNKMGFSATIAEKRLQEIIVPSKIGNTLKEPNKVDCESVMYGKNIYSDNNSMKGLSSIYGISPENDKKPQFYGYELDKSKESSGNTSSTRIKITAKETTKNENYSKTPTSDGSLICELYKEPIDDKETRWRVNSCEGNIKLEMDGSSVVIKGYDGSFDFIMDVTTIYRSPLTGNMVEESQSLQKDFTWISIANTKDYVSAFNDWNEGNKESGFYTNGDNVLSYIYEGIRKTFDSFYGSSDKRIIDISAEDLGSSISDEEINGYYKWVNNSGSLAGKIAIYNITGGVGDSKYYYAGDTHVGDKSYKTASAVWAAPYVYSLYYNYLAQIMKENDGHIKVGECSQTIPSSGWYFRNSETTTCKIMIDSMGEDALDTKLSLVTAVGKTTMRYGTFRELLEWFKDSKNYESLKKEDYLNGDINSDGTLTISNGTEEETETKVDAGCMSGGGGSLSWIICPILTLMEGATEGLYNDYVEPALQIDPKLFSGEEDATRKGWEAFRGLGNVLVIILFLTVIFSQLTGYGIDNYGIKKILPKIIVGAILMNLSYWICTALVDLSNILGNSLQAMFEGFGDLLPGLPEGVSNGTGAMIAVGIVEGLVTTGIVGVVIWQNPALLLTLLISVLGALMAIFFLFVLLSVREAAIVILTVLSSIAVVCFMLPNTKKIFDKWWKLFYSLLMVYPIVGLLVGGGNYVSRLLLTGGAVGADKDFFRVFTAMLVGIVPIFFVPTVLKGSLNAMGQIGAKVSGLGDRFGKGVQNRAKGSERYQNAQEMGMARRARIRAGIDNKGNEKDLNGFGRFIRGGKKGVAKSRAQYLTDQKKKFQEANLMGAGFAAATIAQKKAVESEDTDNYVTLINNDTRNGENEKQLFDMYDKYIEQGNKAGAVAVARIAGRRKDTAARFAERFKEQPADGSDIWKSVAKEMSTGQNSGNYRAATPLSFEYAAQVNRGEATGSYGDWAKNSKNVSQALNNHITSANDLVGMKGSALNELVGEDGKGGLLKAMESSDDADVRATAARIRNDARTAYENRNKPGAVWDSTKEKQIMAIAQISGDINGEGTEIRIDHSGENGKSTPSNPTAPPARPTPPTPPPVINPNSTDSRLF